MLRGLALGAAAGLAWGVLARGFMRLLSTDPAFSWSGTLAILGIAAVAGALVGLARGALLGGRSGWWRVAALPGLLLFAGPGMLLLPGAAGAAMVLRGRTAVRVLGLLVAAGSPLTLALADGPVEATGRVVAGIALFLVATVPLGWGIGEVVRRRAPAPAAVTPATAGLLAPVGVA